MSIVLFFIKESINIKKMPHTPSLCNIKICETSLDIWDTHKLKGKNKKERDPARAIRGSQQHEQTITTGDT
jgi:hypothetical protein